MDIAFCVQGVVGGFVDISNVAESTVGKVLGLIVVLAILGGTIALVFTNLGTVIAAFEGATTGNAVVDAVAPVFAIVIGLAVLLGLAALAIKAGKGE